MCLNASVVFRCVPVGEEHKEHGSLWRNGVWARHPPDSPGCDTAVTSGWTSVPGFPISAFSLQRAFYLCYKCCTSHWIAPCSLWLGVNHNSLEKAPNTIQATSWMREKRKPTSGFPPKQDTISHHPKSQPGPSKAAEAQVPTENMTSQSLFSSLLR